MSPRLATAPLWIPSPDHIAHTRFSAFASLAQHRSGRAFDSYAEMYKWSIDAPTDFWGSVWDFCGVIGAPGERVLVDEQAMPGAQWFPDATLNFAENLLR